MSLKETLVADLKEVLRKGDREKVSVIRFLRNGIQYEEISRGRPLSEEELEEVLARQIKQHRESIEQFRQGNRPDLVNKEETELSILMGYLPPQLSEQELEEIARKIITEVGAQSPRDKGKVMGRLMPQVRGKTDGTIVNRIVTQLLSEGP